MLRNVEFATESILLDASHLFVHFSSCSPSIFRCASFVRARADGFCFSRHEVALPPKSNPMGDGYSLLFTLLDAYLACALHGLKECCTCFFLLLCRFLLGLLKFFSLAVELELSKLLRKREDLKTCSLMPQPLLKMTGSP